jgi:endonuclease YncB( thermonuclease family)
MFGWRKKNDGFVWNDYVRTTILLRREQRKQRIEEVRDAAVENVKQAGIKGAALGAAGASAAARGLWSGAVLAVGTLGDLIGVIVTGTSIWVADRSGPALEVLRRPGLSTPLLLIGTVCTLSAAARLMEVGLDAQWLLIAMLAAGALGFGALPYIPAGDWTSRAGDAVRRLPIARDLSIDAGAALGLGAILIAGMAVFSWLVPALMSQDGGAATSGAVPVMTAASGHIEGKAVALTGDRLRVGQDLVRLFGVEAPASGQVCAGSKSCAASAKAALQKLISGKRVACELSGRQGAIPSEEVRMATCAINGADVAGQLVRGGYVFATTGLFATYASAEREARSAKTGLWRTEPLRPAEHRAKSWDDAKRASPDGCPIKGTVSGDTKTYQLPWNASYEKAKIRASKGERWFCSEAEARAAGWKPGEPD